MRRSRYHIALLYRGPQGEGRDGFSSFVPVGLFFLLHSLRCSGFRARLYNLSATPPHRLAGRIRAIPADAVLISAFYGAHHQAFALARLAKRHHPRAPVVLGGPLSVLAGAILRRERAVDFVLQGEGEESAVALLDALLRNEGEVAAVSGLYRRHGSGVAGRPPVPVADIDRHFFLPSEVLPHCRHVRPENLAVLISSRGCPFRCAFCSSQVLWPGRVRRHRPELLVRYLRDLHQSTGAIYCSIRDENFLASRRHVRAFCRLLRHARLPFLWNCQGSVRFVDDSLAGELAAAGCDQVQMGIETVSPRLQGLLAKQIDAGRVARAAAVLRRHAIRPFGYFIYGMGESREEAAENLAFARAGHLLDVVAAPLVFYPGTALAARIGEERFFAPGEVQLYDPAAARRLRRRWRSVERYVAERAGFSRNELFGPGRPTLVRFLARAAFLARRGERAAAAAELASSRRRWPGNPWPGEVGQRLGLRSGDRTAAP